MAILFGDRKYKYRVQEGLYYDVDLQMMSYMFEICVKYFKVKFSVDICRDRFIETFMLDYLKQAVLSGVEGDLIESVINLELIKRELPFSFSNGAK